MVWMQQASVGKLLTEPKLDPQEIASQLRGKLLGKGVKPTAEDTDALRELLKEYPDDLGVRQLYLHWIDQKQYREQYATIIAATAGELAAQLLADPSNQQTRLAAAFCFYRKARALVYMESPELVAKKPIDDPEKHESEIVSAYNQLIEIVGRDRPEFVLLEIRMLRRDRWNGRALQLLEQYGAVIDPEWYVTKRFELLQDLGWSIPANEAKLVFENKYPNSFNEYIQVRMAAANKSKKS
jgi:hypothetical protein